MNTQSLDERGMTLLETMVWISVTAMVMMALVESLVFFYRTQRTILNETTTLTTLQHALPVVVRTLRTATYSILGAYPIISLGSTSMTFYSQTIPGDNYIQQIRFFVASSSLYEGVTEPAGNPLSYASSTETLINLGDNVYNNTLGTSTFVYYDASGTIMTNLSQYYKVRSVAVRLYVQLATTSSSTLLLTSRASMRNLYGK